MNILRIVIALWALIIAGYPPAGSASGSAQPELVFLNGSEFIDPALIAEFEKRYRCKVREVYFEDDDQRDELMLATNRVGYDLAIINETQVAFYRARGWPLPASVAQIPNLKHIDRDWQAKYTEADGYAVPYAWGTVGIAYRRDQVQTPPQHNDNIEFVVPAEGAIVWADYRAVLAGTRHPELAYAFIDFLNEPKNAARLAAFINCGTPNETALALMTPAYRNNRLIMPDTATLARSELLTALARRVMSFRNTQFARLLH